MSLMLLIGIGIAVTIVFHFIGVYTHAQKLVWTAIILIWAGVISVATSEVKPKAYDEIKKMQGTYADTDKLIQEAMPTVSLYELIKIKNSYLQNKHKHKQ
ncbi:hypothetical protein [Sulfurimonas paralvinellae]|uniref:Uncharacterized protein n=1 Tax=Sulfurimonas paralvinellae TaxID=317658 RepID=A0A7M1B982_9BACT|nr:hypothetical protein [Sulfurimonas paralvinellae]QOP45378.1 hypothetical protein FM071_03435 [Sulfurimonas paralvinellae]